MTLPDEDWTGGRLMLFAEWRWKLRDGHLDQAGLMRLRGLLDPECNVFADDDQTALMRLEVNAALASLLGVDPADLPDAEQLPDTPQGIVDLPRVAPPPY